MLTQETVLEAPPRRPPGRTLAAWVPAAVVGLLAEIAVVVLTVRYGNPPDVDRPAWWGIATGHPAQGTRTVAAHSIEVAVAVLVLCWAVLQVRTAGIRLRVAAGVAVVWAIPLVLLTPTLSGDVYILAALGHMANDGVSPYTHGLGASGGAFAAAVDSTWRPTPAPYGPLMVLITQALAAVGGTVLRTAVLIRIAATLASVAAVAAAVRVAHPSDRVRVLLLTALSPVVLIDLVSAGHLDGLIGLAAIGVVVLCTRRHPHAAMVLAVAAGMVKAPAFLLVGFVFLWAVRHAAADRRWRVGAASAGTAVAVTAVLSVLVPPPLGWVADLSGVASVNGGRAPSEWLGWVVHTVSHLLGVHLSVATSVATGRAIALVVGALVALVLIIKASTPETDPVLARQRALRLVGWGLVVLALASPVLYGWYFTWGLFAVAAAGRPRDRTTMAVFALWAV